MMIIIRKMPCTSCVGRLYIVSCWQIVPTGGEGGIAQDNRLVSEMLYLKTSGIHFGLDYGNFSNIGTDSSHSALFFFSTHGQSCLFINNNESS